MDNLIFCLNAVIPSFIIIAIGFFVHEIGWISTDGVKQLNKLCFHILVPLVILRTAYNSDFSASFDPLALFLCLFMLIAAIFASYFAAPLFTQNRGQIGVFIQGAFRSNIVLLGIPFAISLCGEESAGPMAILVTFIVPAYNFLAVIVFSIFNNNSDAKADFLSVLINIVKNPFIIGAVLGISCSLVDFKLPAVIESPLFSIASAGSTMAMLVVGAQLNFKNAVKNIKITVAASVIKLVLLPIAGVSAAVALGLRGPVLVGVFLVFGTPCAAGSVALADVMGGDGALASEMVVFTTTASIITIFLGSFILKTLALI